MQKAVLFWGPVLKAHIANVGYGKCAINHISVIYWPVGAGKHLKAAAKRKEVLKPVAAKLPMLS